MRSWKKYIVYFGIIMAVIVIAAESRVVFVSGGHVFSQENLLELENCQNVVVLGAGVRDDGSMTPILEERADTARDLYDHSKACTIIVSGLPEEANAVKQYLVEKNVPKNIIKLDGGGKDTFASMINMRDSFLLNSALVVTQDFHLNRAIYVARTLGIDADGYVAYKYYPYIMLEEYKYKVRDILAAVKAVWQTEVIKN